MTHTDIGEMASTARANPNRLPSHSESEFTVQESSTMSLTREVRVCLVPNQPVRRTQNSWSSWSSDHQLACYLLIRLTVQGNVDPKTGFLCDSRSIDNAIWGTAIETLGPVARRKSILALLRSFAKIVGRHVPRHVQACGVEFAVSPFLSYHIHNENDSVVTITHQYEFSAAHRLHSPELSDEENAELFGRCSNPTGHGHNYVFQVTVECANEETTAIPISDFDRIVNECVVQRYDHKHLDEDCHDFSSIPTTVENIARIIGERLKGKFGSSRLRHIRVYETPKTWADIQFH